MIDLRSAILAYPYLLVPSCPNRVPSQVFGDKRATFVDCVFGPLLVATPKLVKERLRPPPSI